MMQDRKRELLDALVSELNDSEEIDQASLFEAKELDAPVDMVRAILTEIGSELISVLGEFFFLPYEDQDVLYFNTTITVTDDIKPDERMALAEAVARINYLIPCGAFSLGENSETMVFRYTVPVFSDLDSEKQLSVMLTSIDAAVLAVDRFEGYLMLVLEGNLTTDEMIDLIKSDVNGDLPKEGKN